LKLVTSARRLPTPMHRGHPSFRSTADPAVAAKTAGLRYVNDHDPGIRRVSSGKSFRYQADDKRRITDQSTLWRIKRLAIPPAWTKVWICPRSDGHIQATGRDARGRKQYRYHSDWRAVRDETKYERMIAFAEALPRIRSRVARDLARRGLGRNKILATIVRLLETTLVRVGNEEYAKANGSVGLSTMQDRHVKIDRGTLHFSFRGKSGKHHRIDLHDARLAEIVRRSQDLPGQELFQYVDESGGQRKIRSEDVNAYLREIAGEEFSAKDFRTWAGTVLAAIALAQFEQFETKARAKKNLVAAVEQVAQRLGNTPAVCRKCYIHPVVLERYLSGATVETLRGKANEALTQHSSELTSAEKAVLSFLRDQLRPGKKPTLAAALKQSVAKGRRLAERRGNGGGAPGVAKSRRRISPPSPARSRRG
jgi:DNA topoisomerase I